MKLMKFGLIIYGILLFGSAYAQGNFPMGHFGNKATGETFTVSFAGEDIEIEPQNIQYGAFAKPPDTPEREGYDFYGWFTDNGKFYDKWDFDTDVVTQDTTLYAKWVIKTYTVIFVGEKICIMPQNIKHGDHASEPENPVREGFDFGGWFTDNGKFDDKWDFDTDSVTQDTTLYAKWDIKTYTITFVGKEINIEPQNIKHGDHASEPANPVREGFDFGGWFTDNGKFDDKWDFDTDSVTQDTTLYAKWDIKTYTITFVGKEINIEPQNIKHGNHASEPENPVREGFDFGGWFSDDDTFINKWDFYIDVVTQDTTLYAKWVIKTYTVTFVGDQIHIKSQTIKHGNHAFEPENPVREGFDFGGWFSDYDTFINKWDFDTDVVTQDTTLYAKWVIKTYTVTFFGEEIDIMPQNIQHGNHASKPENPVREGYDFWGWFTDSDSFSKEWDFKTDSVTQDITLWAKWVPKTFSECNPPDGICIKRKGSAPHYSNILICNAPFLKYLWGYIKIDDKDDASPLDSASSKYQYFDYYEELRHEINIESFKYFVEIEYNNCKTRIFYQGKNVCPEIQSNNGGAKIHTYPNPTKQQLSVTFENDINGNFNLFLRDILGQTVFSKQYTEYRKNEVLRVDFNLCSGLYLLIIETKDEVLTSKIIIE